MSLGISAAGWVAIGTTAAGAVAANSAAKKQQKAADSASYAANLQADIAQEQWDRYKEVYSPLESKLVQEADQAGTPADYAKAASDASATVASQFAKARDRLSRTPGADPSSGAYQAGLADLELGQAAADATQQNAARRTVKDQAYAKKVDAVSLGKGLPAQASSMLNSAANQQMGLANAAGNQAANTASNVGGLLGTVLNNKGVQGWLGNVGNNAQAAFSQTDAGASGFGTGAAYGNQDYGQFI